MSRTLLTADSDWELVNDAQDIRGYPAIDAFGNRAGVVSALSIDTDAGIVSSVILDTGAEIAAFDLAIGDGVVYLAGSVPGAATVPDVPEVLVHHPVVVPVPVAVPVAVVTALPIAGNVPVTVAVPVGATAVTPVDTRFA